VSRHWWVILIPILLDTVLWLGPRASIQDLVQETVDTLGVELAEIQTEDMDELFQAFRTALEEAATRYNALSTLRVGMLGLPSLIIWGGANLTSPSLYESLWVSFLRLTGMPDLLISVSDAGFINVPVWQIQRQGSWLLLNIGLFALGILIGCIYMTSIAWSLGNKEERAPFWPRMWKLSGRFVLFWVLRAIVLTVLGIPFILAFAVMSAINTGLAILFTSVALGVATWLSFYGTFIVAALVMNDASVWHAVWNSISVVLRNFWSTLWLFVLINLIGGGLTLLWQQLSQGAWWTWIAIVGNAYIGTSLVTASLLFYQDRYTRWQEALAELRATQREQAV
jgi:hypothetical protein